MRLAYVLLAFAIGPGACAQISMLRHDLSVDDNVRNVFGQLKALVLFGYPDTSFHEHRVRPLSRFEAAVGLAHLSRVAEDSLAKPDYPNPYSNHLWRANYWQFKWLRRALEHEFVILDQEEASVTHGFDSRVERIKVMLEEKGVNVDDPFSRFSDVPKGHWADAAIHRMRELGILRGFPDNTFRG